MRAKKKSKAIAEAPIIKLPYVKISKSDRKKAEAFKKSCANVKNNSNSNAASSMKVKMEVKPKSEIKSKPCPLKYKKNHQSSDSNSNQNNQSKLTLEELKNPPTNSKYRCLFCESSISVKNQQKQTNVFPNGQIELYEHVVKTLSSLNVEHNLPGSKSQSDIYTPDLFCSSCFEAVCQLSDYEQNIEKIKSEITQVVWAIEFATLKKQPVLLKPNENDGHSSSQNTNSSQGGKQISFRKPLQLPPSTRWLKKRQKLSKKLKFDPNAAEIKIDLNSNSNPKQSKPKPRKPLKKKDIENQVKIKSEPKLNNLKTETKRENSNTSTQSQETNEKTSQNNLTSVSIENEPDYSAILSEFEDNSCSFDNFALSPEDNTISNEKQVDPAHAQPQNMEFEQHETNLDGFDTVRPFFNDADDGVRNVTIARTREFVYQEVYHDPTYDSFKQNKLTRENIPRPIGTYLNSPEEFRNLNPNQNPATPVSNFGAIPWNNVEVGDDVEPHSEMMGPYYENYGHKTMETNHHHNHHSYYPQQPQLAQPWPFNNRF